LPIHERPVRVAAGTPPGERGTIHGLPRGPPKDNGRTATRNSSGIHRVLVLIPVCRRIRALREGQIRREADGTTGPGTSSIEAPPGISTNCCDKAKGRAKEAGEFCELRRDGVLGSWNRGYLLLPERTRRRSNNSAPTATIAPSTMPPLIAPEPADGRSPSLPARGSSAPL
jgi:hypothetical protein